MRSMNQDQHRIAKTHINAMKPVECIINSEGILGAIHRELGIAGKKLYSINSYGHTGGWLENWPDITIEETCATCKQEITTAFNLQEAKKRRNANVPIALPQIPIDPNLAIQLRIAETNLEILRIQQAQANNNNNANLPPTPPQ